MTSGARPPIQRLREHHLGAVSGRAFVLKCAQAGLLGGGLALALQSAGPTPAQAQAASQPTGLPAGQGAGQGAGQAPARAARMSFNIPAQDLNGAVLALAQKAGVRVFFDTARFGGRRSGAVQGTYSVSEALDLMLRGSGLTYRFTAENRVTIVDPSTQPTSSGAGVIELDTIDVEAQGNGTVGYVASTSIAGTKTDTPLVSTPQSVSVITRQELDDRNVQTLTEAVAYTPGVRSQQSGYDPRYDTFTVRGFDMTYNGIYRDGLRLPGANMSIFKVEPYGVQSVTVLRGPSSALYGLGSPGGIVDITSKRPTEKAFGEVEVQGGNYDWWQGQFDIGGPADKDGTLLYRLTGLYRDAGAPNVVNGGTNDMTFIAPAFTWKPSDSTRITFLGEYQKSTTPASMPFYSWTGTSTDVFSKNFGDYNALDQEQWRVGYLAEHDIDSIFTVRQNLRYGAADTSVRYTGLNGVDAATNTASRYSAMVQDDLQSFVVDNQLQANFNTGPVSHTVLVGLDYSYLGLNGGIGYGTASDVNLTTLQPLGPVFDPALDASRYDQNQNQLGLYLQDQAKVGNWILTLAGRQDWVTSRNANLLTGTSQSADDSKFTYRAGITYLFDNGFAPYASYATSFSPNVGVDVNGNAFVPTTARQVEAGLKYVPKGFDGYFAVSLFQINQDNGLVTDDTNPLYQVQTGEVRARGIELEAVANFGSGFRGRGAYTYLDMVNVAGDPATVGLVPSGTPEHTFAVWLDYQFQPGTALAGLGIGGGVRYVGSTWGNALNTFQNSAYTLVDAKLSYDFSYMDPKLKGWNFQINAQNLLDADYVTCDAGYCYMGAPRTVIAGLKYRW